MKKLSFLLCVLGVLCAIYLLISRAVPRYSIQSVGQGYYVRLDRFTGQVQAREMERGFPEGGGMGSPPGIVSRAWSSIWDYYVSYKSAQQPKTFTFEEAQSNNVPGGFIPDPVQTNIDFQPLDLQPVTNIHARNP